MKSTQLIIIFLFLGALSFGQETQKAFQDGEKLRYKMSYSGFLRAGTATLSINETLLNGKKVYHATGKGWTTGILRWVFKVKDNYQSYFDKDTVKPYLFKRKINEGGYKKHIEIAFDYQLKHARVKDFRKKKDTSISVTNVQDILSSFYYLRNQNVKNLKIGDEISIDMFLDAQIYKFKLLYLGKETLKTKFGNIKTIKFRPIVQSGRIFKAEESVTIWVTSDANKIPIKIEAALTVGSLRAELESYRGLANSFKIVFD